MPSNSPIAGQWLGKLVPQAVNTCATVEAMVDVRFLCGTCRSKEMWPISSSKNFLYVM
jgi:hypothetical protein